MKFTIERLVTVLLNIPIKFRAVATEDFAGVKAGDTVFGGINATGNEIIDFDGIAYEVEPATVRQFAGYDADGFELWEGDLLVDRHGNYFTATLDAFAVNADTSVRLDFADNSTPKLRRIGGF